MARKDTAPLKGTFSEEAPPRHTEFRGIQGEGSRSPEYGISGSGKWARSRTLEAEVPCSAGRQKEDSEAMILTRCTPWCDSQKRQEN